MSQESAAMPDADDTIYDVVDLRAGFEGGLKIFCNFLMQNINIRGGQTGETTLEFVVEKDGSVSNVTTVFGDKKWLNKELVRVVSQSPRWLPAYKSGKPVRTRISLPLQLKDSYIHIIIRNSPK